MFARYPEKGKVKSRLCRHYDADAVVNLYCLFIKDMIDNLSEGDYLFRIAYDPIERGNDFRKEFGYAISYMPQTGVDLGEKMRKAFKQCFSEGIGSVVIIGSDSPDLPPVIIQEAFEALKNSDAVIGPCHDGGYYLIGFCRESFTAAAFEEIPWGTEGVFQITMETLRGKGICVHVLPEWRDIDRPEDIAALIDNSRGNGFVGSKTIAFLCDHGLTER